MIILHCWCARNLIGTSSFCVFTGGLTPVIWVDFPYVLAAFLQLSGNSDESGENRVWSAAPGAHHSESGEFILLTL